MPVPEEYQSHSEIAAAQGAEHRTFANVIATLEEGELNQDLTDKLKDLVASLTDAQASRGGKPKGSITLTMAFSLDGGAFDIKTVVKVVQPKEERRKSVMWATPNNNLSPVNPRQAALPFRVVNQGVVRTVRDDDVGPIRSV